MISDQLEHPGTVAAARHDLQLENATAAADPRRRRSARRLHGGPLARRGRVRARGDPRVGLDAEADPRGSPRSPCCTTSASSRSRTPSCSRTGPSTDEEVRVMRTHPIESERIVARLPGLQHLKPGSPRRARALRREGLSRRPRRRGDSAREPHRARRRCLPRDGLRPPRTAQRSSRREARRGDRRRLRRAVLPDRCPGAARDPAGVARAQGATFRSAVDPAGQPLWRVCYGVVEIGAVAPDVPVSISGCADSRLRSRDPLPVVASKKTAPRHAQTDERTEHEPDGSHVANVTRRRCSMHVAADAKATKRAAGVGFEPTRHPQRMPSCFQGSRVRPLRHPAVGRIMRAGQRACAG